MRITLLAAQSLDGFITHHETPGTAFTSNADKAYFAESLRQFDCSVMGGVTYRVARSFLLSRLTHEQRRVVLTRDPAAFRADAVEARLEFTQDAPATVVTRLRALGHRRCALLGGSQIHHLFFTARLVDELWITIEPKLFGTGTPFLTGRTDVTLTLRSHERLAGDTLLLKYDVAR